MDESQEMEMEKKKIAFFQLGDCGGDELEFLNLDGRALDLLKRAKLVQSTLLGLKDDGPYDIALVEGIVASEEDLKKIKEIREKSKVLVALGSCATLGGLPGLKRNASDEDIRSIYGNVRLKNPPIDNLGPLDLFVKIDYYLHGCPVDKEELFSLLKGILDGLEIRQGEKRFPFLKASQMELPGSVISLLQDKCILCGRCVEICSRVVSAIGMVNRGFNTMVSTPFKLNFDESSCISCGLCTVYCPAAAIIARDDSRHVEELLKSKLEKKGKGKGGGRGSEENEGKLLKAFVEVEAAAAIGEAFGLDGVQMGRLASALRLLGFDDIILVSWKEMVLRHGASIQKEGSPAMLIPCSEAAKKFVEISYPELLGMMTEVPKIRVDDQGAIWIAPCTSKKLDARIPIVTTREIIRLIRSRMEFKELEEGGYKVLSEGLGISGRVRIVQGIPSIREELEKIQGGRYSMESLALFVCPEGCVGGGGQPPIDIDRLPGRRSIASELEALSVKAL
ncbi:MAG: [Fe-Fe] hydrogenase large subunit C-terminal domain-containing protein [Candidatus Bathyarchaeia archaeon]